MTLEESISAIKQQTIFMKRSLETKGKLMDALKHASMMLSELRTNNLTPKQYYELYILTYDSLQLMSQYLIKGHPQHHLADLYELVQYAGNILPRLYLMVTVGTAYMSCDDAPKKEIMKDMIEMIRGVQHPIRGLFLRYYLSQRTKDLLPGNKDPDTIQFVMTNFIEMNKLWVRLQHQGPSKEREKRIKERQELQILVGSNLVRLSQILEDDVDVYKMDILPAILEQVVQCRDPLAQEYLLDVLIQVFSDEFHLQTLEQFLEATNHLHPEVSINKVVVTLCDRLTSYADREDLANLSLEEKEAPKTNLFFVFWKFLDNLRESRPDLSLEEFAMLLDTMCKFVMVWYPQDYKNLDLLYKFALDVNEESSVHFIDMLKRPILQDVKILLKLPNYQPFLSAQSRDVQGTVAGLILDSFLDGKRINQVEHVELVLKLVQFLIVKSTSHDDGEDDDNHAARNVSDPQQEKIAKLVHLFYNKDLKVHTSMLDAAWKAFRVGDIASTYPSLVFNHLKLARRGCFNFKTVATMIEELSSVRSDLAFKLNLDAAAIADQVKQEEISYDFFAQAFGIYEETISDSKTQYQNIVSLAGYLQNTRNLSVENYDTLITRCTLHGSKLLKKPDQCRAVYLSSHLWWATEIPQLGEEEGVTTFYRDGKRVLECLQRSLRGADSVIDSAVSMELFVEILNRCLYYFIHGTEQVNVKYINGLIELIKTNTNQDEGPKKYFARTLQYIMSQRDVDPRFKQIIV